MKKILILVLIAIIFISGCSTQKIGSLADDQIDEMEKTAGQNLKCSTQLDFNIGDFSCNGDFSVDNKGKLSISSFQVIYYSDDVGISTMEIKQLIEPFMFKKINIGSGLLTGIDKVGLVPGIEDNGRVYFCDSRKIEKLVNC